MRRWLKVVSIVAALLCAVPAQAGDDGKIVQLGRKARALAERMQAALDPDECESITSCRTTMAAGILDDGTVLVATSDPEDRFRSPVESIRREEGAVKAIGRKRHAEVKILNYPSSTLFQRNTKVLVVAAGRPICELCEPAILRDGVKIASPCKSGRKY